MPTALTKDCFLTAFSSGSSHSGTRGSGAARFPLGSTPKPARHSKAGAESPARLSEHNPQLQEKASRTIWGGIAGRDSAPRVPLAPAGAH